MQRHGFEPYLSQDFFTSLSYCIIVVLAVNKNLKAQAEQVECMTMEMNRSESRVSAQSKEIAALKEQIGKKDDEIAALNAQVSYTTAVTITQIAVFYFLSASFGRLRRI